MKQSDVLPIEKQILILEQAKTLFKEFYKEQTARVEDNKMPLVADNRGALYLCKSVLRFLTIHLGHNPDSWKGPRTWDIPEYIPSFTVENAVELAKKYKFKKPYECSYWWTLIEVNSIIGTAVEWETYDYKNRIAFMNAVIKELKAQL